MTDILKHSADSLIRRLLPQQQILNLPQRPSLPIIDEMIPAARVAVQQRRRFEVLFPIRLAPFTLEAVVGIARRVGLVLEQLLERIEREVPLDVFGRVDDAGG